MGRLKSKHGNGGIAEEVELVVEDMSDIRAVAEKMAELAQDRFKQYKIKKAKIKDDLFLEVEFSEELKDGTNDVKKSCTAPIHDDLKVAFRKLDDHLCRLCEQYNSQGDVDTFDINCKGFTLGGNGDNEGVVLIGYRGLVSGKYLNLVSPMYKWNGDDYEYINELAEIIEECKHEVKLYLFDGKHQPEVQQELPFGEGDNENANDEEL